MKIVVAVRTRDESRRIGAFCAAYAWADSIIVADGGSADETISIAAGFPNVILRAFGERTPLKRGHWRNNDSAHINHLIRCAQEVSADWIVFDDCDCRPNYRLREEGRAILEGCEADVVMAVRVYLWGLDEHFPLMAKPAGDWEAGLWAWRPSLDLWTVDVPPAWGFRIGSHLLSGEFPNPVRLMPPYCLLHYSWDDPSRVEQKVKTYRDSGLIPGQLHPLEFAGPLEPLPDWARE